MLRRLKTRQSSLPGKVFDLTLPLDQAADGYRAMDERRAIQGTPATPNPHRLKELIETGKVGHFGLFETAAATIRRAHAV